MKKDSISILCVYKDGIFVMRYLVSERVSAVYKGLFSSGLKIRNFQNRTEPIRLFIFYTFCQSSKTNWRCFNNEPQPDLPLKPALYMTLY